MQEKDFNGTWIGTAYNYFSNFRMIKNVLKATSLSQAAISASLYLATPIAKKSGNDNIINYTQYGAIGVSVVLNPLVTIPMLAVNYVGDKLLAYKWDSMTPEQKESAWGKELHAAMMVAKQEIAFKAGEVVANQYQKMSSTPNSAQQYEAQTIKQVDDLTAQGYQPQVPKTKNGQVVKGKYEIITPQRAKELLSLGQTVEFKNPNIKGANHKMWVTRNNPYKADSTHIKVDQLTAQGHKPQVPKRDKYGKIKPGKYKKITKTEAKELLNKGETVEFKHWCEDKPNRKIWLSKDNTVNNRESNTYGRLLNNRQMFTDTQLNQQQEQSRRRLPESSANDESSSDSEEELSNNNASPQTPHFPKILQQLGCSPKKLTPERVAHTLWLANGRSSASEYRAIKSQFSFWAKQNQPELEKAVDEIIRATYNMS